MKKILFVFVMSACVNSAPAQLLKKLKDKVNNSLDKKVDNSVGIDKPSTETEKKVNAASDQYSDATENNEKPIFVDKAPAKMVLQLKKGDLFWGGYIQLKGQPKKTAVNATILDSVVARVGSLYTAGR